MAPTEEQSAAVKAVFDIANEEVITALAVQFPLEWDEWNAELANGDRPLAVGTTTGCEYGCPYGSWEHEQRLLEFERTGQW